MTTNEIEYTTSHRRTILMSVAAILLVACGIFGLIFVSAGAANATPRVTVGAGDRVNDTVNFLGINLPAGICTVTSVGYDQNGAPYAVFMGHCSSPGHVVHKEEWSPIGTVQAATFTVTKAGQMGQIDVGLIKIDPRKASIRPSGIKIASPVSGTHVKKHGNGLWSPGIGFGTVTNIASTDFTVSLLASPGDSGSPVTDEQGNLVGMMSRGFSSYTDRNVIVMNYKAAMDFAASQFGIVLTTI